MPASVMANPRKDQTITRYGMLSGANRAQNQKIVCRSRVAASTRGMNPRMGSFQSAGAARLLAVFRAGGGSRSVVSEGSGIRNSALRVCESGRTRKRGSFPGRRQAAFARLPTIDLTASLDSCCEEPLRCRTSQRNAIGPSTGEDRTVPRSFYHLSFGRTCHGCSGSPSIEIPLAETPEPRCYQAAATAALSAVPDDDQEPRGLPDLRFLSGTRAGFGRGITL